MKNSCCLLCLWKSNYRFVHAIVINCFPLCSVLLFKGAVQGWSSCLPSLLCSGCRLPLYFMLVCSIFKVLKFQYSYLRFYFHVWSALSNFARVLKLFFPRVSYDMVIQLYMYLNGVSKKKWLDLVWVLQVIYHAIFIIPS